MATATFDLTQEEQDAILDQVRLEREAAAKLLDAYRASGFTATIDGEEYVDSSKLRKAVIGLLCEHPVTSREERDQHAVTKHGLVATLFPSVPEDGTPEYDAGGVVAERVWKDLMTATWRNTDPKSRSGAQKIVGDRGDGMVLVRGRIRVGEGINASMQDAAYITTDETLLIDDFAKPFKDAVKVAAEQMATNLGMVAERNPALAERLTRELDNGMKAATRHARSTLALSTGSDEK
jgi:hypothetical protein